MRGTMLAIIAALGCTGMARAQGNETDADLRCVAVLSVAISQAEEAKRGGLVAGMLYFVGRLDGRAPGTMLESELRRVAVAMTDEQARAEGMRCATLLAEKGQQLQVVGQALQAGAAK